MTLQPTLFDHLAHIRQGSETIEEAFIRFHNAHPEVYAALVDLCRRWKQRGGGRWSVDAAFHVLRWERRMDHLPDADELFKLNDHYTSRFARLILEREPELEGIFEVRGLRA